MCCLVLLSCTVCCLGCLVLLSALCLSDIVDSFYSVSIMCCLVLLSALCLSDMVDSFYSVSIVCCFGVA